MSTIDVLRPVTFGQRVAEEEGELLAAYFVETDHWYRVYSDSVDVIYGPKGSGKSALYSLLVAKGNALFDRGVLLAPAENPRGAPAFRSLVTDPPVSEREFVALWKLYLACLMSSTIDEYGISGEEAKELSSLLAESGLKQKQKNLQSLLQSASNYVKSFFRPTGIEGEVKLDPITQVPTGVSGKILFGEPSDKQVEKGLSSVDRLLELANAALEQSKYKLWILLDRLDVAFSDSSELEQNALRALFQVYLDLFAFKNVRLKIFLRSDIWRRITESGFREASHITRHLTIVWNEGSLLNLVVRRAVQNSTILEHFHLKKEDILASIESQRSFFYQIFPDQVDVGSRKPRTFEWMLGRTCDGSRQTAPRELIHLLNALRDVQVRRLEMGDAEPEANCLFSRLSFKEALVEVSRTRLEQTLYAEYPDARQFTEQLRGEKTQYSLKALCDIWKKPSEDVLPIARMLVEIGFFEERGDKEDPTFWVPLLYRDALDLIQGAAI